MAVCLACTDQEYAVPATKSTCRVCKKEVSWREVVSHYIQHGKKSGADVVCPLCNSKVKGGEFRNHVRRHFAVQQGQWTKCGVCGKSFRSTKSLLVHILKTHEA